MRKFRESLSFALRGIWFSLTSGRNFRIQGVIAIAVIVTAVLLRFTYEELIAVVVAIALVLTAEMINTIMEEVLDVIAPQYSEHVGRVKDIAAGVVLLLSFFSVVIGGMTVFHHFGAF
jgi:diacylglycerol kinase